MKFTFLLDSHCAEGIFTVYVAVPGATASTTFEVVVSPTPIILLAPPGQAGVGERSEILCFVYPGLQVNLLVALDKREESERYWAGTSPTRAVGLF
ncbi:MAG: hypothetical protein QXM08_05085, partial [Thermofilaceae archaeon]